MLGAKVFTATKARDRDELGEVLTRWLRDNPRAKIVDKVVTQSSDREFHCLSITIFYEVPRSPSFCSFLEDVPGRTRKRSGLCVFWRQHSDTDRNAVRVPAQAGQAGGGRDRRPNWPPSWCVGAQRWW